jgi:hypothetical protein
MSDDLDALTNTELNQLFARQVCGFIVKAAPKKDCGYWVRVPGRQHWSGGPDFCADANAVLPWLEKHAWQCTRWPRPAPASSADRSPGGSWSRH